MPSLKDKAASYSLSLDRRGKLRDKELRARKAAKIIAVLDAERALDPLRTTVLDIGCSRGHILAQVARRVRYCVGIDIDDLTMAEQGENFTYVRTDAEKLPFASGAFDVILCNHVYEHTDRPERLVAEIRRLLSPTGVCYFAGPNRYAVMEPHVHLPFVSWLPKRIADAYVRSFGRGDAYNVSPRSRDGLHVLLDAFSIKDYTGAIICEPARFMVTDLLPADSLKQCLAQFVLRYLPALFPTFVFVLRARDGSA